MNEQELRNLMYTAQLDSTKQPFVIRYPRGEGVMPEWKKPFEEIQIGKGRKLRDGKEIAILSFGHPGNFASSAIRDLRNDGVTPSHYDMRFAKPLDEVLLHGRCKPIRKSLQLKMELLLEVLVVPWLNSWLNMATKTI